MSVLVEIYKVPQPGPKEVPHFQLTDRYAFPFADFPEEDTRFLKDSINLNELVMTGKGMTFYAKVKDNYPEVPYKQGDVLVVNRAWPVQKDKMVVCCVGNEFELKQVRFHCNSLWLEALDEQEEPIMLTDENRHLLWGVVTHELRRLW